MTNEHATTTLSPPHRLATALVCATFPLIWIGGLVTSSQAGMAVPDWPNTFGYNLFLYPWTTWYYGPYDIFVEHGHRLFAAAVGFLTICLCLSFRKHEPRVWLRRLGYFALGFVIFQGVLGGLRVVLGKQLLAMIHGCVGPLFFALAVTLWHFTDRKTVAVSALPSSGPNPPASKLFRLALITTLLAYVQLVFGAAVRHVPHMAETVRPELFRIVMLLHLFMAAVLTVHVVLVAVRALRSSSPAGSPSLRRPAILLIAAIVGQLALGAATWVVNYGYPQWAQSHVHTPEFVVRAQSTSQSLITTAHVAVGSLILVTSLVVTLRARLLCGSAAVARGRVGASSAAMLMGGVMLRGAAV
ncbi:MAG: COX15/CtaA family protein [Pirellulales bacterium]